MGALVNADAVLEAGARLAGRVVNTPVLTSPELDAICRGEGEEAIPELPVDPLGIHAVYPPGRYTQPKVRAFIDFLAHAFADKDPLGW